MPTFNGEPEKKKQSLERVASLEHRMQQGDERQLLFWTLHQGCDLNCTIGDCNHTFYADEIGVPAQIAYAERAFFMLLAQSDARGWPRKFVNSLPIGVELPTQWADFALTTLNASETGIINYARNRAENDAIVHGIELLERKCNEQALWDVVVQKATAALPSDRFVSEMNHDEALVTCGRRATETVLNFARSFHDPRYAGKAIESAADCARWKSYAQYVGRHDCTRDQHFSDCWGGHDYWKEEQARKKWTEIVTAGAVTADKVRNTELLRLADELVSLIRASDPVRGLARFWRDLLS
jgi:hypothetical protein